MVPTLTILALDFVSVSSPLLALATSFSHKHADLNTGKTEVGQLRRVVKLTTARIVIKWINNNLHHS